MRLKRILCLTAILFAVLIATASLYLISHEDKSKKTKVAEKKLITNEKKTITTEELQSKLEDFHDVKVPVNESNKAFNSSDAISDLEGKHSNTGRDFKEISKLNDTGSVKKNVNDNKVTIMKTDIIQP